MTIPVERSRKIISGSGWENPLTHAFPIENAADVKVYADSEELTLGVHYSVSGVGNPAGYSVAITDPGDWAPAVWVLDVLYPINQPSDVDQGGQFGARFENALDRMARSDQVIYERALRSVAVNRTTPLDAEIELPAPEADSVLGWNVDGTGVENKGSVPQIQTVAAAVEAIKAVAGDLDNIDTVADDLVNIDIVAGIAGNVTIVAGIAGSVVAVAANKANIDTVAGDLVNIDAVATNIGNVNTVAGNSANINAVAGNSANINTVAANIVDVNTVAANIGDVQNAHQNAQDAATAKTAAEAARDLAQKWATNPEDVPVSGGLFSAFHWAQKAATVVVGGIAAAIAAAASKAVLADADMFGIVDSANGNTLKRTTWANIKAHFGGAAFLNIGTASGTAAAGDDSRFTNSREWTASTISQAEAEAGVATSRRAWTAERVAQAIAALAPKGGVLYDQTFLTSGTLAKDASWPAKAIVDVEWWAAGAGGSNTTTQAYGSGGGGGGYHRYQFKVSDLGASETFTVGAGGGKGVSGGSTSFKGITVYSGGGGLVDSNGVGVCGGGSILGAGGSGTGSGGNAQGKAGGPDAGGTQAGTAVVSNDGTTGGGAGALNAGAGGKSIYGGGGGGNGGAGGTSIHGGNGGAANVAGSVPGGGGGRNAVGADGQLRIRVIA